MIKVSRYLSPHFNRVLQIDIIFLCKLLYCFDLELQVLALQQIGRHRADAHARRTGSILIGGGDRIFTNQQAIQSQITPAIIHSLKFTFIVRSTLRPLTSVYDGEQIGSCLTNICKSYLGFWNARHNNGLTRIAIIILMRHITRDQIRYVEFKAGGLSFHDDNPSK